MTSNVRAAYAIDETNVASGNVRTIVLELCYFCLIRLGDLSRWRETLLVTKHRNWGPALGYYDLARTVFPEDGTCWHQRAVIAQLNEDYLEAAYGLYRSLTTVRPHPCSRDNLEIQLQAIVSQPMSSRDLLKANTEQQGTAYSLSDSFLQLHAFNLVPQGSRTENDLEDSCIRQLQLSLYERSSTSAFSKTITCSLATEYVAEKALEGEL